LPGAFSPLSLRAAPSHAELPPAAAATLSRCSAIPRCRCFAAQRALRVAADAFKTPASQRVFSAIATFQPPPLTRRRCFYYLARRCHCAQPHYACRRRDTPLRRRQRLPSRAAASPIHAAAAAAAAVLMMRLFLRLIRRDTRSSARAAISITPLLFDAADSPRSADAASALRAAFADTG